MFIFSRGPKKHCFFKGPISGRELKTFLEKCNWGSYKEDMIEDVISRCKMIDDRILELSECGEVNVGDFFEISVAKEKKKEINVI